MLCDLCHKNIATVHLTEIVNDKIVEMHICQKCAQAKTEELKEQLSISDLLGGLVELGVEREEKVLFKCPTCGLSYSEFKKKGKFGCRDCYTTFKQQLLPLLKKIHGAARHTGKFPNRLQKELSFDKKLEDLNARLNQMVKAEEYEEAARLRDEIRELEKKNKERKVV